MNTSVTLVEVGPRDGFQSVGPFIPTEKKLHFLTQLDACGLHDIEIGSFVSQKALPQLADTPTLLELARDIPRLRPRVLVPTLQQGRSALAADAPCLAFVLSVSEAHNRSNVRRTPEASASEYVELATSLPDDKEMRLNIGTAFDCPFEGRVQVDDVVRLLEPLISALPRAEFCLCDTTGRADPKQVSDLFKAVGESFGRELRWAFHAHDTYGLGAANVYAAFLQGVRVFDASIAGLGGCPFAPGATGNVATEDLIYMFEKMGVSTGCDLDRMVALAGEAALLPGAQSGGRARQAITARYAAELNSSST